MKRRVVLTLGAAAVIAACASLDGLSSNGEGGAPDASSEAANGDAGSAASDGAPTSPFCQTQPDAWLCESFDERPLPGAFTDEGATGSSVRLDDTDFASPPHSLAIDVTADTTTAVHFGNVSTELMPSSAQVTMEAKAKIVKAPTVIGAGPRASLFAMGCGNDSTSQLYSVLAMVRPSQAGADVWLTTFTPPGTVKDLSTYTAFGAVGSWQTLRMIVDWTQRTVELRSVTDSGSALIGSATLTPPAALTLPPPYCELDVGLYSNMAEDGWSLRIDDVAIHRQ